MDNLSLLRLQKLCSYYIPMATTAIRNPLSKVPIPNLTAFVSVLDASISFYFRYCGLVPCSVNIDDQTYMHFWAANNPKANKPNLLILHGYGADSKWQFLYQIGLLSKCFNVYAPDLIFFGKSYSKHPDRSDAFQARCAAAGLKKLGVMRYSVYGISYGGYVGYHMAEMYPEVVEKIVIASSGITCTKEQKVMQLETVGKDFTEVLLPQKPEDLRLLINLSFSKCDPFKWFPDVFLKQLINVLGKGHVKEKKELVEYLIEISGDDDLPAITQETLLLWGEKDKVFPLSFGMELQRKLGSKARLEIIKNTGHASNMESANELNYSIKAFILGSSKQVSRNGISSM